MSEPKEWPRDVLSIVGPGGKSILTVSFRWTGRHVTVGVDAPDELGIEVTRGANLSLVVRFEGRAEASALDAARRKRREEARVAKFAARPATPRVGPPIRRRES